LWLALGRRPPTRRFTYGYGKAEDVAGVVVLALVVLSAAFAGYEAIDRPNTNSMAETTGGTDPAKLLNRGRKLEAVTLGWNAVGLFVLAYAAVKARSVALAGFGIDSLIEIGASTAVLWELADGYKKRQRRAMRLIGWTFVALALYLVIQSTVVLIVGIRPHHSPLGIVWTAVTALVMFALAAGKARTGSALGNPVLQAEGRITMIDGILATTVLAGLVLNASLDWWWADPLAAYVLLFYAVREARDALGH
jgi:divalent metal cation (Fe/Co/Zn/Cd) transporter